MADTWVILDLMLRGAGCSTLFACAVLFSINPSNRQKSVSIVGLAGALIAYLLVSTPNLALPPGLSWPLIWVAGTTPVWVYWASVELFHDDVSLEPWQVAVAALIVLGSWFSPIVPFADLLRGALVILLFSHLLYAIIASAEGDLVEERRRFRKPFVISVIVLIMLITTVEALGGDEGLRLELVAIHAGAFWLFSTVFLVWSARITSDIWFRRTGPQPSESAQAPADIALAAKVTSAMKEELWREENLTIGVLANRLGTQEHRLRRTINRVMGHRNFASFVNGYRIEAAKQDLADPDKAESAILTIAYDVGFASIGPFNRAFRLATGMSPSEFRRNAIGIYHESGLARTSDGVSSGG